MIKKNQNSNNMSKVVFLFFYKRKSMKSTFIQILVGSAG